MKRSLRFDRDDRGVVALELVLALPFLLMLIVGIVVLGNFFSIDTQTVGLARDGARSASLRLPLPPNTPDTSYSVVEPCGSPTDPTDSVTVEVINTVSQRSIPFLPSLLPPTITRTVTMRCGG